MTMTAFFGRLALVLFGVALAACARSSSPLPMTRAVNDETGRPPGIEMEQPVGDEAPPPMAAPLLPEWSTRDGGLSSGAATPAFAWTRAPRGWPTFGPHTATLLPDGRVLVVGRVTAETESESALFDPSSNRWTSIDGGPAPLLGRSATLLADGRVLVVGGTEYGRAASAETALFDPTTERWAPGPSLSSGRAFHTAVRLPDGRVHVAGGHTGVSGPDRELLDRVVFFDPNSETWAEGAPMLGPRERHTATVLNGVVVVIGGLGIPPGDRGPERALGTVEMYAPERDVWSSLDGLDGVAIGHSTTLLADGSLLVVSINLGAVAKTWHSHWYRAGSMRLPRSRHVAVRLADDRVLVAGGAPYLPVHPEIYDSQTASWTTLLDPPVALSDGTGTLLPDGRVLLISSEAVLFEPA